jgi:hypothetical protein
MASRPTFARSSITPRSVYSSTILMVSTLFLILFNDLEDNLFSMPFNNTDKSQRAGLIKGHAKVMNHVGESKYKKNLESKLYSSKGLHTNQMQ